MKDQELIPLTTPQTSHREVIGGTVSLPNRFPIMTDGLMFPLADRIVQALGSHAENDYEAQEKIKSMVQRLIRHARETMERDGAEPCDWNYTVTIAIHHKGEATDFWVGDQPEEKPVSKKLETHLTKPQLAHRIVVRKP